MIIRRATREDVPAIVELACESVSIDPLPVTISRPAMAETIVGLLGRPTHFVWVSEMNGKVEGAMVCCVSEGFWFEKHQCSILMYFSRVTGGTVPLLREFTKWVKSRSTIKVAVFELEPGVDPRLVKFLKRQGFVRESLNLTYVRK